MSKHLLKFGLIVGVVMAAMPAPIAGKDSCCLASPLSIHSNCCACFSMISVLAAV
jgi:hypothetical protein